MFFYVVKNKHIVFEIEKIVQYSYEQNDGLGVDKMINYIKNGNKSVYPVIYPINNSLKSINCYLYKHNNTLTMIDAGINTEDFKHYFEQQLKQFDFKLSDIDQIVLTHHHSDHIGLVNWITEQYNIPVYAHSLSIPRLHLTDDYQLQKIAFFTELYKHFGCLELAATRMEKMKATYENSHLHRINCEITPLYDCNRIGDLQVLETPGHSLDSVALYDADTNWLFAGDLLLSHGTSNALIDHDSVGQLLPTVTQFLSSLKKCQALDINYVFSGHQSIFSDIEKVIENNISKIDYKFNRLIGKIEEGNSTITQLAFSIYGNRVQKEETLILSDIIGYISYAESLGKIKCIQGKQGIFFTRVNI